MSDHVTNPSGGRREVWFFVLQRLSAMILAPLVLIHLATMVYAIQDGLSAAEILARTKGSWLWGAMYGTFVVAAAVHGAIGLRTIIGEMTPIKGIGRDLVALIFAVAVLILGFRAVSAVI